MSKKERTFFSFLDQFKDDLVSLLSKLKLSTNFCQWNFFISNYIRNSFARLRSRVRRKTKKRHVCCLAYLISI